MTGILIPQAAMIVSSVLHALCLLPERTATG
jgi:hypothetical protein